MPTAPPQPARPTKRFGQGIEVDRLRPHFFHRDYWILHHLGAGVTRFITAHAEQLKGQTILDLGAGDSPYQEVADQIGAKLLAADIHPASSDVIEIDPVTGRVAMEDGFVAGLISTQVLEHVADVQAYLREAYRLLKPGGVMFCSTHGAFILHRHPTDYRRWTLDGLALELKQAGFEIQSIEPKIGILANATHLRAIAIGGLTRRIPLTGWLRPIIYGLANARIAIEDALTPASVMPSHPELLLATVRKPLG